jgi:hypothetical protein
LTGVPVIGLLPVAVPVSSLTLVAMEKVLLKFSAGVNVTAASKALTSAIGPLALHIPVALS